MPDPSEESLYVESSAILAWLLGEPRAGDCLSKINGALTVVCSVLTILECERALIRAERQGRIVAAERQKARVALNSAAEQWIILEVTPEVSLGAGREFPAEPVRTLDAIHLATALEFLKAFKTVRMLSFDDRITKNAELLGIEIV